MRPNPFLLALLALLAPCAFAGSFGISPLMVQFTAEQRTAVLNVTNDGDEPITLRVVPRRWTQAADGTDEYVESNEVVAFPRRLPLAPGQSRVVRVGFSGNLPSSEQAYRLFVEELAPPEVEGATGTRLSVLVTIGVPMFAAASNLEAALEIERVHVSHAGELDLTVANPGNRRARIAGVSLVDGPVLAEGFPGQYVFPGITKSYALRVPDELCDGSMRTLVLDADTPATRFDVQMPARCGRPR